MMNVPQSAEVLDVIEQPMRHSPSKPQPGIDVPEANNRSGEANARLYHDSSLLRVDSRGTAGTRRANPAVERTFALERLAAEMRRQAHPHAGMRQVFRHETMTAPRTFPEGCPWQLRVSYLPDTSRHAQLDSEVLTRGQCRHGPAAQSNLSRRDAQEEAGAFAYAYSVRGGGGHPQIAGRRGKRDNPAARLQYPARYQNRNR